MKKIFLMGMLAAGLLASSCRENVIIDPSTVQTTVTFALQKPDMGTRAYADGSNVTTLTYAVYEKAAAENAEAAYVLLEDFTKVDEEFNDGAAEISLVLPYGKTYEVVFWADAAGAPYSFDDDTKEVTVDYAAATCNDNSRDAFYARVEFVAVDNALETVMLKRPFAQVNLAAYTEDYNAFAATRTSVKVPVYTTLNLSTGAVSGTSEAVFASAAIPESTEIFPVDDVTVTYLAMNYLLVPETKELVNMEFVASKDSGDAVTRSFSNVPVRRNWRTNVFGQLLTGDVNIEITTDPIFAGMFDETVGGETEEPEEEILPVRIGSKYYKTIETALAEAVDGNVINLSEGEYFFPHNITLSGKSEGKITLEGEGEGTIVNGVRFDTNSMPGTYADGVELEIRNLLYKTNNDWLTAGFTRAKSVTFEDCTIIGGYHTFGGENAVHMFKNCIIDPENDFITVYGSDCTFEGCTFNSSEGKAIQVYAECWNEEFEITVKDCKFTAAKNGSDQWYDGGNGPITAIDVNCIRGNKFTVDISNCSATGYGVGRFSNSILWNIREVSEADTNINGNECVIVKLDGVTVAAPAIEVNGSYYKTLAAAFEDVKDGDVINIEEGTYEVPAGATGKTLTFVGSDAANVTFKLRPNGDAHHDGAFAGSNITFENLTLEAYPTLEQYSGYGQCEGTYRNCTIKNVYTLYGTSLFENCTFEVSGDKYNVWTWGSGATFNECIFNCSGKAVLVYQEAENHESTLNFTECVFNDSDALENETKAAIETGANNSTTKYTLNIVDCEINGFNNTQVKSNLGGTNSGDNIWGNKNMMTADNLDVFINGTEVY